MVGKSNSSNIPHVVTYTMNAPPTCAGSNSTKKYAMSFTVNPKESLKMGLKSSS